MEEDAGKNTHVGGTGGIQGADYSLVDYNRGGVPLVEIVTKPIEGMGIRTAEVARAYVATIRDIVRGARHLGRPHGAGPIARRREPVAAPPRPLRARTSRAIPFGKRSETKNVNSLRAVERSIHYEAGRQAALLLAGEPVVQETRHWHEDTSSTTPGRSKEEAEDYRYFPEPDLLPVEPSREWVEELRATIPEHPAKMRARLQADWGFADLEMRDVVAADALDFIADTVAAGTTPQAARKWWMGELARVANERDVEPGGHAGDAGRHRRAPGPRRRGHHQRQARAPGARGHARGRGLACRRRGRSRARRGVGRLGARGRRRRGARLPARGARQDPRGQASGRRRDRRRRHEGHQGPGRCRRACARSSWQGRASRANGSRRRAREGGGGRGARVCPDVRRRAKRQGHGRASRLPSRRAESGRCSRSSASRSRPQVAPNS